MAHLNTTYSLRVVVNVDREGNDTPEKRHKIVTRIKKRLHLDPHTRVDLCEVRETKTTERRD